MVRSDQLYQIDLRLRELTMKPSRLFGGVAVFVFGDIMQLKPVKGRYIWSKPQNADFHQAFSVQPHWDQFDVISLVENHRQEGDKKFADILNRIRVGEIIDDDMHILKERVRPSEHSDLQGATVIACKHVAVNDHNSKSLRQIDAELIEVQAINTHSNIPNFFPKIDAKKGTVGTTAYLQNLQLKVGCRLMIIDNIDINDQLCNGSSGTLEAVVRDRNRQVQFLMILLDNKNSGREMRRCHPKLSKSFPGLTPIKKQIVNYPLSAKARSTICNSATVQQFPVIVSFASTTHKIQGQTISAPRKAAVDLNTVFEANQAYVMLGRVQKLEQLYIIDSLPRDKIITNPSTLKQLETMKDRSLNKIKPTWEKYTNGAIKVYFNNVQSIRDKIGDIKADPIPFFADVMIFAETWLDQSICNSDPELTLKDYNLSLNSVGRGKGLAIFFQESKFKIEKEIKEYDHQITKLESENVTIIALYRSQSSIGFGGNLMCLIPETKDCLIIGDFNICSSKNPDKNLFDSLKSRELMLITNEATHLRGGHIDQAWLRRREKNYEIKMYSPYYTCKDHDALLFTLYSPILEQGMFKITTLLWA